MKPKLKKRIPWETDICQHRNILHHAVRHKENQPTPENVRHFNEAQKYLVQSYENEHKYYVHNKISETQYAMCNKKSVLACKIVNEFSGRNNSNRAKLKANSEKERIQLWNNHFKELLGKPSIPTSNDESTLIIQNELDIKKGIL